MVCNEHHRMPITTPLTPPRASPPMESILDACRASLLPSLIDRAVVYIRTSIATNSPTVTLLTSANNVRMNLYENKIAPDFPSCSGIAARRDYEAHDSSAAAAVPPAPLRPKHSALAPCTSAAFIAPTAPLRQQNSALAPCTSAAFIAPTAPLRQQNSALAPCTSAAFIAPTVPLRQQNSALAPCTCYGSKTRHVGGFHRPHCAATATELGPRAMCLLRQQHPALAPFISGTSDSDHSRRSHHDRRDHR